MYHCHAISSNLVFEGAKGDWDAYIVRTYVWEIDISDVGAGWRNSKGQELFGWLLEGLVFRVRY